MNKPIIIEECLAPTDNELKKEIRERNIKSITKQLENYAYKAIDLENDPSELKNVW